MEPSAKEADLVAGGRRGGGLVPVQRPRLPDPDQPDFAESDDGRQEAGWEKVDFGVGKGWASLHTADSSLRPE